MPGSCRRVVLGQIARVSAHALISARAERQLARARQHDRADLACPRARPPAPWRSRRSSAAGTRCGPPGRSIVIFAIPSAVARRTSRSGCPRTRRQASVRAAAVQSGRSWRAKASLWRHGRRGLAARAARTRPERRGASRRPTAPLLLRRATPPRARGARELRRARGRPRRSGRDRAAAGLGVRRGLPRLPAARRGRRAGRPAPGRAERARICDGAARWSCRSASASSRAPDVGGRAADSRAPRQRHDLDASAAVIHTSGTTSAPRPVELTYGNFLWSALGSAVALDLDPASAGCARCRSLTSAACRSWCARRSTPPPRSCTSASTPTGCWRRCARGRSRWSRWSPRRSRACSTPAWSDPPALRCALTGGGPVPAALCERAQRGRGAGQPRPTG